MLIILDMQTTTSIISLVSQISFSQHSLPYSMSRNIGRQSGRKNVWPPVPISRIYCTALHETGSTSVAQVSRTEIHEQPAKLSGPHLTYRITYQNGLMEARKALGKYNRSTGRYLNPGPPDSEATSSIVTLMTHIGT